jgi:hypothetical protein
MVMKKWLEHLPIDALRVITSTPGDNYCRSYHFDGRAKAFHAHSISGFVIKADQDRRNITLRWDHKWTKVLRL